MKYEEEEEKIINNKKKLLLEFNFKNVNKYIITQHCILFIYY
jgi:hypothetical protein